LLKQSVKIYIAIYRTLCTLVIIEKFSKIWSETQLYHILDTNFENDL